MTGLPFCECGPRAFVLHWAKHFTWPPWMQQKGNNLRKSGHTVTEAKINVLLLFRYNGASPSRENCHWKCTMELPLQEGTHHPYRVTWSTSNHLKTEEGRGNKDKSLLLFLWEETSWARYPAGLGFAHFNDFRGLWGFQLPLVVWFSPLRLGCRTMAWKGSWPEKLTWKRRLPGDKGSALVSLRMESMLLARESFILFKNYLSLGREAPPESESLKMS